MLTFLEKYAGNVHSQNGEDFLVREAWNRITGDQRDGYLYNGESQSVVGTCCEIGGNDGHWMSNCRHLIEQGWECLFVEGSYDLYLQCKQNWKHNPRVRSQCCYVDERNINAFVDDSCDLLSLDLDGPDYQVFAGMKARPKIVIVEIDSSIPPDSYEFNSDGAAGYARMVELGLERGYFLLCHTGNCCFVREEYKHLFPEIEGHPLLDHELYFNRAWLRTEVVA